MSTTHRRVPEDTTAGALQELAERLTGRMVAPGDPEYHRARRFWNSLLDVRPRAVVRAGSVQDIDLAVAAAQRVRLPLAVRGGGHGVAGSGALGDCLLLDLGRLRQVVVDPANQLVSVEPGTTIGGLDRATTAHGLAVPLGTVSTAGIAGLALGGGMGWLTRSNGLTLDNLDSADVVTATGDHLHASEEENPELFWGLRGGGGNFGVVSSFTFSARRMPALVLAGSLRYRRPRWTDALRAFARWAQDLPDELNPIVTFGFGPPGAAAGDEPSMTVQFCWVAEDHVAGRDLVDELRADAPPDAEDVAAVPWLAWQGARDGVFPRGSRGRWQNLPLGRLDDEVVDVVVRLASRITVRGTGLDLHRLGGAFGRVAEESTAFPNRSAPYWLTAHGVRQDSAEDERLTAFTRTVHEELQPFAEHGQYLNLLGPDSASVGNGAQAVRQVYGREKLQRLVRLKDRYDPGNLFRLNLNVAPSRR
ncbi:FAD-binding protein [Kocuria sediminis]|uniref:FAD-binding protein n=1 Tax=Kocuria sediminis TaxID=1038857 RepID=A0A6N8GPV2_9MICC|nr:FAD-binding protein [Kocuria sediminis]MUN64330.1 FAD-binding protein [Kocuria sediminis]